MTSIKRQRVDTMDISNLTKRLKITHHFEPTNVYKLIEDNNKQYMNKLNLIINKLNTHSNKIEKLEFKLNFLINNICIKPKNNYQSEYIS